MEGEYLIWLPRNKEEAFPVEPEIVLPNLIVDEGKDEFYKMIFQNVSAIAGAANWFIGLCDQVPAASTLLPAITTEPTVTFGYSRKAVVRSAVGWPTLSTINSRRAITSLSVTWTAAGGPFSRAFSRPFLTDQTAGTVGKLYSLAGPRTVSLTLLDTQSMQIAYRVYL